MKRQFSFTTLLSTVLAGSITVVSMLTPFAAAVSPNQTASQALEIAPPVIPLSANPGETVKAQISLRDVSTSPLVVTGQINDFVAGGEDGTPKLLIEEGEESPYSMKSWFSPLATLTLKPREVQNLTITINVPHTAAPGGYYSVIRFSATPPDITQNGVSLGQPWRIGSDAGQGTSERRDENRRVLYRSKR